MVSFRRLPHLPVREGYNQRFHQGFHPKLIRTHSELGAMLEPLLSPSAFAPDYRLSLRAVIDRAVSLADLPGGFRTEARIPLGVRFPSCNLVYLARNPPERQTPSPRSPNPESFSSAPVGTMEAVPPCFYPTIYRSMNAEVVKQIADLIASRFRIYCAEMPQEAIRNLPLDHIVATFQDAHGEKCRLAVLFTADCTVAVVEGKPLHLFEFTHVIAASGVPHAMMIPILAKRIVTEGKRIQPKALFFAETVADVPALQQACADMGMRSAGTMVQSFRMQETRGSAPAYRDAHVWYIPTEADRE